MSRKRFGSCRGTAYVEYCIAAAAMAAATVAVWSNFGTIRAALDGRLQTQMSQIAGSVSVPGVP